MLRKNSAIITIIILSLIPVFIWLFIKPLGFRFSSPVMIFYSLGQLSALVGMVLFSLNLVISTRLQIFEGFFGGLNKVYNIHHYIGSIAFILLLFHPLMLLSQTLPVSLAASASFLLPEGYLAKDLGVYGLGLMIMLLILTFFVGMRYEIWRNSHRFLGTAFFLGALHSFMIPSDISSNPALKLYMLTIVSLGAAAYVYRTILGTWTTKKYQYEIIGKRMLADNMMEFSFKAIGRAMEYEPGQFVFISFRSKYLPREVHPFSISSGNSGDIFKLTIKVLGDYTSALKNLEVSEKAHVEGPFGRFGYKNFENRKQVWIGAGVGVTPFMGMIDEMLERGDGGYDIEFYFCTRDKDEQAMIGELVENAKGINKFKYTAHCSADMGRINAGFISQNVKDIMDRDFLICGPPPLMQSLRKQLRSMGLANSKIHTEEFSF